MKFEMKSKFGGGFRRYVLKKGSETAMIFVYVRRCNQTMQYLFGALWYIYILFLFDITFKLMGLKPFNIKMRTVKDSLR